MSDLFYHLYVGDCLNKLKNIDDNSIDFIPTDPPFNVNIDYGNMTNDNLSEKEYVKWLSERLNEFYRVLKTGHYMIIFIGDCGIKMMFDALNFTDFHYHHLFKWNKPHCQRALKGTVLFNRTECGFVLSKGKPNTKLINRKEIYSDTLTVPNTKPTDKNAVDHPARRPIKLYEKLIRGFSNKGDIILDPFLGSGTSIRASFECDRNCIGIEINPEYLDIIKKRCRWNTQKLNQKVEWKVFK